MTAGEVREAARLMRERAQATDAAPEGAAPWFAPSIFVASGFEKYDAVHIASWPPAAALAVADLLDRLALRAEAIAETHVNAAFTESIAVLKLAGYAEALTLARAYLGGSS